MSVREEGAGPALSYWHEPGEQPLLYETIGQVIGRAAREHGEKEALVCMQQQRRLSFRELVTEGDRLAAGLLDAGLKRGDRVAIWAANSWRWVVSKVAIARAGLVSVDLNPQYREAELAHCLRLARVAAVVMAESHRGLDFHDVLCAVAPELRHSTAVRCKALPDLRAVITMAQRPLPGALQFDEVMSSPSEERVRQVDEDQWRTSPDSVSCIQLSSGTTGRPKAILVTHRGVVNNSQLIGKRLCYSGKAHRVCLQVPLFHAFGTVIALFPTFHFGATTVLPADSFSSKQSLLALQQERCSVLMGTPTMYVDLVREVRDAGVVVKADTALVAGAPITPPLARSMSSVLGLQRICNGYGLSETSAFVFQGMEGDDVDCMANTVGRVSEHTEAKVVDENGRTVPFGVPGELLVRGYAIMKGYFNDPEATEKALVDGWLKTGDKFVLQEDGYGRIQGRIKDMIIRGGENIYPKEVENIVAEHPDVLEAEVVGVPDARLGEEVCACLRMKAGRAPLTAAQLRAFCKAKMADYKLPRYCSVLPDFPRTLSGKIQKFVLREQCAAELAQRTLDDCRSRPSEPQ